jgi:calcium/calmodulin-dependent 3',5'-cyclic nucleotide phosphodiesterase
MTSTGRFESIKAIIQASSFVNALQRQLRQHTKERLAVLLDLPVDINKLNLWSFNMMEYHQPILFTILLVFDAHDLISRYRIDLEVLKNFARALTEGYTSNVKNRKTMHDEIFIYLEFRPIYHNDYHGADVLQTTHCLLTKSNLLNIFTQIEITALVSQKIGFFLPF